LGEDAKISLSIVIIRYSVPPLVCYAPGAEEEKIRGSEDFFENLSAPSPLQLKTMEGASDENNPGHACVPSLLMPVFFLLSKRFS